MKQITLEYYGVTGQGATVKEAKADAGRRIQELTNNSISWNPVLITWQDWHIIIMRGLYGWGYKLINPAEEIPTRLDLWQCSMGWKHDESEECIAAACLHLSGLTRQPLDDSAATLPLFDAIRHPGIKTRTIREYHSRCRNEDHAERRRIFARSILGLTGNDIHDFAHCNPSRYDLWKDYREIGDYQAAETAA